jgi:hypothetical protein
VLMGSILTIGESAPEKWTTFETWDLQSLRGKPKIQ